ncbi:hypothetical protein D9613_004901 [Agrocybe pediades]|uniref:F-box domain-containing protein n=1 Tax=Agrocybe pediades TaxID=84607 RepID=A0A8H4VTF3_9AGAR|nr:hypothetical protein D9613_004901 [Agrocybe pediades]
MPGFKFPNCEEDCFCSSLNLTANNALDTCKAAGERLCDACNELFVLEAQILRAHDLLVDLKAQYHVAKTKVNNAHDRFSGHIPPEISSRIFEEYMASVEDDKPQGCKDPAYDHIDSPAERYKRSGERISEALVTLASVSRNWKTITRTTPSLWRSITIPIAGDKRSRLRGMTPEKVETWLKRSGGLPVKVSMYEIDELLVTKASTRPYTDLLLKYIHRWQNLRIQSSTAEELLLDGIMSSFSSIKTLEHLEMGGETFSAAIPGISTLKTLRFFWHPRQVMDDNWRYFTVIRFDMISIRDAFTVLSYAFRVEDCTLYISNTRENIPAATLKTIVRPQLKHLVFGGANQSYRGGLPFDVLQILLRCVEVPSLQTLVLKEFWGGSSYLHGRELFEDMIPIFRNWVQQTSLTKLTITGINYLRDNEFLQILQAMPSTLTHVSTSSLERRLLAWNLILDHFFQALQATSGDILLPNLCSFEYWGCQTFQWDSVLRAIRSRLNMRSKNSALTFQSRKSTSSTSDALRFCFHLYTEGRYIDLRKHDLDADVAYDLLSLQEECPEMHLCVSDANDHANLVEKVLQNAEEAPAA